MLSPSPVRLQEVVCMFVIKLAAHVFGDALRVVEHRVKYQEVIPALLLLFDADNGQRVAYLALWVSGRNICPYSALPHSATYQDVGSTLAAVSCTLPWHGVFRQRQQNMTQWFAQGYRELCWGGCP